jgi:hypothetical protein
MSAFRCFGGPLLKTSVFRFSLCNGSVLTFLLYVRLLRIMIALAKLGRVGSAHPDDCGPHQTCHKRHASGLVLIVVKSATSDPGPCSSY